MVQNRIETVCELNINKLFGEVVKLFRNLIEFEKGGNFEVRH